MTKLSSLSDIIKANRSLLSLSFFCVVGACAGQDPTAASEQGKLAAYEQGDESDGDDDDDSDDADQPAAGGADRYTIESDLPPEQLDEALIALTDDSNPSEVISEDVAFTSAQCTVLSGLANGPFHDQAASVLSDFLSGTRFDLPAGRSLELTGLRSFSVEDTCRARIDIKTVVHRPHLSDPKGHLAISGTLFPAMRGDKKALCFGDLRMGNTDFNVVVENIAERAAKGMVKKMDDFCFDLPEMLLQWEAAVGPIDWTSGI